MALQTPEFNVEVDHEEGFVSGSDGNSLFRQSWLPRTPPRAIVLIAHGLGEHSDRYANVVGPLVDAGYGVHALDHRGHGRSDGKRAFVKKHSEFTDDLDIIRSLVASRHPGVPIVLLGHSMGGNIALAYALDHQSDLAALVLSGPALTKPEDLGGPKLAVFKLLGKVAPSIRPEGLEAEAISRDPKVVETYLNDPLVFTGKVSAGLGLALFSAMDSFPDRHSELRLPTLLVHGTEDRLVDVNGTRALEAGLVNADVTSHYYEGLYHEVFNEPEHAQVVGDLLAWLDATLR